VFALGPEPVSRAVEDGRPPTSAARLWFRALLNLLVAYEVLHYGYGPMSWLVGALIPWDAASDVVSLMLTVLYVIIVGGLLVWFFGRMGRWPELWRRYLRPWTRIVAAALIGHTTDPADEGPQPPASPQVPAQAGAAPQPHLAPLAAGRADPWQALRSTLPPGSLALLDAQTAAGRATDVDHTRVHRAWRSATEDAQRLAAFAGGVRAQGASAFPHPSGARDLAPRRSAHDLLLGQVRLGRGEDVVKNPPPYRGAEVALDQRLLGTSLLAVGPAATGKTSRLVRPVAESLCLQALCGTAVVVVVGAADADLGPDDWYDVVVAPGDPARARYGLDLFGASRSVDEAAGRLADALLPEELALRAESARGVLHTVCGAFRAGYERDPGVRELCVLLRGEPRAWAGLRESLAAAGRAADFRAALEHRERQHGRADDLGALLADRLELLDRPGLAESFNSAPEDGGSDRSSSDRVGEGLPLFAVRALEHPLRVRVVLPERSHPEAARIVARLVCGQFLHAAAVRRDRSLFAGLVLDDASAAVDLSTVRGLQRIRGANAGAVLALRSLADLPEGLRAPLFGAVGCRMAFPGLAPWDGRLFSEAWGTVWISERDVTRAPDTSGGFLRRGLRGVRSVLQGERVQTESVTIRRVERERWSPSDLAHALPSGHAVLSLSSVDGASVPPILLDLRAGS